MRSHNNVPRYGRSQATIPWDEMDLEYLSTEEVSS